MQLDTSEKHQLSPLIIIRGVQMGCVFTKTCFLFLFRYLLKWRDTAVFHDSSFLDGAEGSRTPVRKTSFQAFYVRRLCFNLTGCASTIKLVSCERNKFPE